MGSLVFNEMPGHSLEDIPSASVFIFSTLEAGLAEVGFMLMWSTHVGRLTPVLIAFAFEVLNYTRSTVRYDTQLDAQCKTAQCTLRSRALVG